MRCEQARELIDAYVDGELSGADRAMVATHVNACPGCRELVADIERVRTAVADQGREPAPKSLVSSIRSALASAAHEQASEAKSPAPWHMSSGAMRQAAALAVVCILSILATWWGMTAAGDARRLQEQIVSAHVRSLLQDSPIQVASSDIHTVKPWFAGRVDFAPDVKDLASEGFPLLGGRLDYVHERRVGALVYRHRLHIVNVFMWPAPASAPVPPVAVTKNGYNLLAWNKGGIAYWAVSDVDIEELRRLQTLL
jgi:anti-sigma factor RsiW